MHMLGVVAGQRGDFREGARLLTDALKIRPNATDGYINLGRMQAAARGLCREPARAIARRLRSIRTIRSPTTISASFFAGSGSATKRSPIATRRSRLAPNYPEAWNNRGNALFDLGRHDEALESYDRALGFAPGLAEAMLGRGNVLLALERFEEAVASYDKALSVRPDNADCHAGRGLALRALKRFAPAAASYDRALAIDPDNGDGWFGRANALHEVAAFSRGGRELRTRCWRSRPDFAEAYYGRGRALQALKRFDDALADFDAALAMKPFFADCLLQLRQPAARAPTGWRTPLHAFERLLDFAPDHDFLKGMLLYTKMFCCDWDRFADFLPTR